MKSFLYQGRAVYVARSEASLLAIAISWSARACFRSMSAIARVVLVSREALRGWDSFQLDASARMALFHSSSSESVIFGLCNRFVFMSLCLLVCVGSFELGAILAQGVGCGNEKMRIFCVQREKSVSLHCLCGL